MKRQRDEEQYYHELVINKVRPIAVVKQLQVDRETIPDFTFWKKVNYSTEGVPPILEYAIQLGIF